MPIKTIFVPLTDADGAEVPLDVAMTVGKMLDATVDVVHLRADPTEALGDFVGETVSPQLVDEVLEQAEQRGTATAAKARKAFDTAKAKTTGVKATYQEVKGRSDYSIETKGRLSDLIVVRRSRSARDAGARVSAEVALMGTGRPVLVVPAKGAEAVGGNVAIAWNGSLEASKAVAASMPFLTRAKTVTVITATDEGAADQKGVLDYLARQGVKAKGMTVKAGDDAGRAIASAARRAGADLIVMGAYTHSRMRELLFGGVTEHALSDAKLPVLMIH